MTGDSAVMTQHATTLLRVAAGTRNVLVPTGSRRGAAAGVSLITRSKWYAVAAQWALWGIASTVGPRGLPGEGVAWEPPGGAESWTRLQAQLPPFDEFAVYARPQASRAHSGLAMLLLRDGRAVGFLKIREDPDELDREERGLRAFDDGATRTFRAPRVLDRDSTAGLHWMLISTMPARPASPAWRTDLGPVLDELQDRLTEVLPRPAGTPGHWRPMHGDLTAWNLRRVGPGLPWLIDWEDTAWAPPGADLVYYRATSRAAFGRSPAGLPEAEVDLSEAVAFWRDRVTHRSGTDHDSGFTTRLLTQLTAA